MGYQAESFQVIVPPVSITGVGTIAANLDANGLSLNAPAVFKQDGFVNHNKKILDKEILAASVDNHIFTVLEGVWKLAKASYKPRVAGSGGAATLDLKVVTGTQAPTSGTTQLATVLDLVGVADTLQTPALIAAPTEIGPGAGLALDFTGTLTSVVGSLHIELTRIR